MLARSAPSGATRTASIKGNVLFIGSRAFSVERCFLFGFVILAKCLFDVFLHLS